MLKKLGALLFSASKTVVFKDFVAGPKIKTEFKFSRFECVPQIKLKISFSDTYP